MATEYSPEFELDRERSIEDQPRVVLEAEDTGEEFDENGWPIKEVLNG